jgi:isocitrate lyase
MLKNCNLTECPLAELAARYKDDGMLAYVELVQRKEKEIGCDVLTHQKWFVSFSPFRSEYVINIHDTGAVPTTSIR